MNSKRIKFALFISVFVLYGCASGSKSMPQDTNRTLVATTVNTATAIESLQIVDSDEDMSAYDFDVNEHASSDLYKARDQRGTLQTQSAMQNYSSKIEKQLRSKEKAKREKEARTFIPYTTTYGVDCYGCGGEDGRGSTAIGVRLDANLGVRMPNGTWQKGIRYGKYYIIAADQRVPFCSIIKISNHGLSGSGLSPNEPYYGIVLDRGGAIHGTHLDLYVGLEKSNSVVRVANTVPKAEIIRLGGQNGPRSCSL